MALNFFMTGTCNKAVKLLVLADDDCSFACRLPAVLWLTITALYLSGAWYMLWHFNKHHRKAMWEPLEVPDDPDEIEDPLYRFISKVRVRFCRPGRKFNIMDRATGDWTRGEECLQEPQRTERLLNRPYALTHSISTDAQDALKLFWLSAGSGFSWLGVFYNWGLFTAQLAISSLQGLGGALTPGTGAASAQIIAIMSIQFSVAFWMAIVKPEADRIGNAQTTIQFSIEATQTLMLFLTTLIPNQPELQMVNQELAFYLGLASLFLPILSQLYDAVVVQISTLLRRSRGEEFSIQAAFFAMFGLCLSIPGLLAKLGGFELGDAADDLNDAVGEAAGLFEASIGDAAELAQFVEVLDGLSALAGQYYWAERPTPQYHHAAMQMQRIARGRKARKNLLGAIESAKKIQSRHRGCAARRTVLQKMAQQREDRDRHRRQEYRNWLQGTAPGFAWLEKELDRDAANDDAAETGALIYERLRRARAHRGREVERATSFDHTVGHVGQASQRMSVPSDTHDQLHGGIGIVYTDGSCSAPLREAVLARRRANMANLPDDLPPIDEDVRGATLLHRSPTRGGDMSNYPRLLQRTTLRPAAPLRQDARLCRAA